MKYLPLTPNFIDGQYGLLITGMDIKQIKEVIRLVEEVRKKPKDDTRPVYRGHDDE